MEKRKSEIFLKQANKRFDKIGDKLKGIIVDPNPKIAEIELQALGIAERVKKEGLK